MRTATVFMLIAFFASGCGGGSASDNSEPTEPSRPTGNLKVVTSLSGEREAPDGYTLTLDDTMSRTVGVNDSTTFSGLRPGSHSVELKDLASTLILSGSNTRNVTVTEGETTRTTFEVAGADIAFERLDDDADTDWEISVMATNGSGQTNLTEDLGSLSTDVHPTWSPDRRQIAFSGDGHIRTMQPDGSVKESPDCSAAGRERDPDWSPDGEKLVFESGNNEVGIRLANIQEGDCTWLTLDAYTNESFNDFDPDWSPDGSRIAFTRAEGAVGTRREIRIIDPDGTDNRQVAEGADPAWSPTGDRIAFKRDGRILTINPDGSEEREVVEAECTVCGPVPFTWSPDGSSIAYVDGDGNSNIYVVNNDGGDRRQLTDHPADEVHPEWSPGSNRLVFIRRSDDGWTVQMVRADGTSTTALTEGKSRVAEPDWSAH